ncbi:MAG: hypothetical protein ISR91_07530 [Candidatus Delongbacteria bacterium]|nr:hypothetical protein [Candidatus Delongbacteria bacterium]
MTTPNRPALSLVALLLLLTSCSLDDYNTDDLPNWNTTLELPLLAASINLATLLDDSLIHTIPTPDGDSLYAYRDTLEIEEVQVGDELLLEPLEDDYTQFPCDIATTVDDSFKVGYDTVGLADISEQIIAEVGLIELENIAPQTSEPFPFRQIMPLAVVENLETILDDSGGSAEVVIDPIGLLPLQKLVVFDSFNEVVLASGSLEVTIINNMFIYLGTPLTLTLLDTSGVELFSLPWDDEIPPGEEATQSVDVSGYTIPGALFAHIAGMSNGTHSQPVLIDEADLDSWFTVQLVAQEFRAESAWAQIPPQTIEGADLIQLEESDTRVEEALLASCDLQIDITNGMELTGIMLINIPDLISPLGEPWQRTLPLPLDDSQYEEDLTGWTMQLELDTQQLDYNYLITTDDTDPEFAIVEGVDSALLDLLLSAITFSEITGIIEQQVIVDDEVIPLEGDTQIETATIGEGLLQIRVDNAVGGSAQVLFTVPELLDNGVPLSRNLQIEPGANQHLVDLAGYELVPPSLEEQLINCLTVTTTDTSYGVYNLEDSIRVNVELPELVFSQVTGIFNQSSIVEEDSLSTDSEHIIEEAGIMTGRVTLQLSNNTGIPSVVDLSIEQLTLAGEPLTRSYLIPADIENYTRQIDLDGYRLQLPADRQYIDYTSTLSFPNDGVVTMFRTDSLVGTVSIDTVYFANLTGAVDSLTVESDSTTETIDLLPEELEGVRFSNVDMAIACETDIGGDNTDSLTILLSFGIRATNPDGDEVISLIDNWNILDSNRVQVPNATELINILPDRIETWGSAIVDGHAEIESTQYLRGNLEITIPFEFEISENAVVDLDPELLDVGIPDEVAEAILMLELDNQFEFGSLLTVLVAADTIRFDNGSADTLLRLELAPLTNLTDTILLPPEKVELLIGDSTWIKGWVDIIGQVDGEGNPLVTRIMASDSLNIYLHGRFGYHVDLGAD